jgi:hypothetical protein
MRKMLLVVTTMLLAENSHAKRKRTSPHMRMLQRPRQEALQYSEIKRARA